MAAGAAWWLPVLPVAVLALLLARVVVIALKPGLIGVTILVALVTAALVGTYSLVAGTLAAAGHYELTGVAGGGSLLAKIVVLHVYPSDMAQNFWGAIWAWTVCFVATALVSLATSPRRPEDRS